MLGVLLVGQAMASMDVSLTAVAAPAIRADLGATGAEQQLLLAGYTLAFAVLVVTGARLGVRYGQARMFTFGLGGFTLASLCCGAAPGPTALVAARVGQGVAGALMVPQVLALIHQHLAGAARARAIGRYSMVLALGVAGGQILGGALVTVDLAGLGWRAAFLVNVPIGVALLRVAGRVLPDAAPRAGTGPRTVAAPHAGTGPVHGGGSTDRLDVVGVVVLAGGMLALVLPLVLGRELGWPGWLWAALLGTGAASLLVFARYERRLIEFGGTPLLDLRVLTRVGVRSGLAACCLVMGGYAGFLFALVLRLQDGLGHSALAAGLAFVPYAVGFAICGLLSPRLSRRAGDRAAVAGPLVLAVAAGTLAWMSRHGWPWWYAGPLLLFAGAGHAAGFSPLVTRISARVPATSAAALSALVSTGTLLASALGVAGVGGVYLAVTGPDGSGSAAGLGAAVAVVGGLLVVTAMLARRATRHPAGGERPEPVNGCSRADGGDRPGSGSAGRGHAAEPGTN
jgi:MFS family permease